MSFGLALPDNEIAPTCTSEAFVIIGIAFDVSSDLGRPKGGVRLWHLRAVLAFVPMPETAMNKNDLAMARKNQAGLAW